MDIAIVDYKMSNLHSVHSACKSVGLDAIITSKKTDIINAKCIILPGVGAFRPAMNSISSLGIDEMIIEFIKSGKLFVGICLGMQLLFEKSFEFQANDGLGILKGDVVKINADEKNNYYTVPQIGWNKILKSSVNWNNSILSKNSNEDFMYFVHSYIVKPKNSNIILTETEYGETRFCSSLQHENIFACQFHPEKSGPKGLLIYQSIKEKIESM